MQDVLNGQFDVLAFGAHPDDLEVVMGGTMIKLVRKGLSVLFVDLCEGEPARHAVRGERHIQAKKAAEILGVERTTLTLQDRLINDTVEARLESPGSCASVALESYSQRKAPASIPTIKPLPTSLAMACFTRGFPNGTKSLGENSYRLPIRTKSIASSSATVAWNRPGTVSTLPSMSATHTTKRWRPFAFTNPSSAEIRQAYWTSTMPRIVMSAVS